MTIVSNTEDLLAGDMVVVIAFSRAISPAEMKFMALRNTFKHAS